MDNPRFENAASALAHTINLNRALADYDGATERKLKGNIRPRQGTQTMKYYWPDGSPVLPGRS